MINHRTLARLAAALQISDPRRTAKIFFRWFSHILSSSDRQTTASPFYVNDMAIFFSAFFQLSPSHSSERDRCALYIRQRLCVSREKMSEKLKKWMRVECKVDLCCNSVYSIYPLDRVCSRPTPNWVLLSCRNDNGSERNRQMNNCSSFVASHSGPDFRSVFPHNSVFSASPAARWYAHLLQSIA